MIDGLKAGLREICKTDEDELILSILATSMEDLWNNRVISDSIGDDTYKKKFLAFYEAAFYFGLPQLQCCKCNRLVESKEMRVGAVDYHTDEIPQYFCETCGADEYRREELPFSFESICAAYGLDENYFIGVIKTWFPLLICSQE